MKRIINNFLLGLLISFTLVSCNSEDDIKDKEFELSIHFSNGTVINENNILFYDSSTCIFFLKEKLSFIIGPEEAPYSFADFSVYVDEEKIYEGIVYPNSFAAMVPEPYIASKTYPIFNSNILEILNHNNITNDYRIIESLKNSNLLRNGISLSIESINIASYEDSTLRCSFTVKNNDSINYYIPNPLNMGISNFNNYTGGGLRLKNLETNTYHWANVDYTTSDINILTIEDLSILESKSEKTFTYTSSYAPKIIKGIYEGDFRYNCMYYFSPVTLDLEQENGRVWVGSIFINFNNIIFE